VVLVAAVAGLLRSKSIWGIFIDSRDDPPGNPLGAGDRVLARTGAKIALEVTYLWNCLSLFGKAGTTSAVTGLPAGS